MSDRQPGTVVIGGGQAGLAIGYHLRKRCLPFVVLDENDRIGDAWRKRWESLRLYRNPSQVQEGGVLVVGAGNSGAEIAIELSAHHRTWLSGRDTGQEPTRAGSPADHLFTPLMWFLATRVLTVNTPFGRKVRDHFFDPPRGIPLGRVRRKDFADAGIERVPRMTGVRNGSPAMEDGSTLDVSNVIWCTGFTPAYDWIDLVLPTHNGVPVSDRGIVESCPGLYFVGLPFLYSLR